MGSTGRVPPPIVCKRSRQESGNKYVAGILPNTGQLSTRGGLAPGGPTEKLLHVRRLVTSQQITSIHAIDF